MGLGLRPPTASVDRFVAAPSEAVWQVLVDLRQWPHWGPSVRRAALDDGTTTLSDGAQGTVWTAVGIPLRFAVTDFQAGCRWGWAVAGVTATGHSVRPEGNGCRVRFDVPWWATAYLAVCAVALARIEKLAVAASRGGA